MPLNPRASRGSCLPARCWPVLPYRKVNVFFWSLNAGCGETAKCPKLAAKRTLHGHRECDANDPMYGPAVRCKRTSSSGGKRSCINVSGLLLEHVFLAIMDISARATSLAERPQQGHLGHQCSHTPGRPNLHLVSSSRRPRQVWSRRLSG
jgi:hypothetical protein